MYTETKSGGSWARHKKAEMERVLNEEMLIYQGIGNKVSLGTGRVSSGSGCYEEPAHLHSSPAHRAESSKDQGVVYFS
jgi:hypothetical protein